MMARKNKLAALKVDHMILLAAKDHFHKIDADLEMILQMFADRGIDGMSAELLHARIAIAVEAVAVRITVIERKISKLERR